MKNTWNKITSLPAGGTISGISGASNTSAAVTGNLWLCSPAGLFYEKNGLFKHQQRGIPFHSTSAVLAIGKIVLAAGYPNYIVYSPDGGRTWFSSRLEQLISPVTCFVASPNFNSDGTLLAGSDGDGILRSTDSGGSWQFSNFGLRSLNILDLACAPDWSHETASNTIVHNYEIVFAATEAGVYMSPNAGRAWRLVGDGLPPVPVLSVAVSPDFKRKSISSSAHYSGAVFAGTEGAGLHRSQDGGQSWHTITSIPTDLTINTMFFDRRGALYVGTSEHGILVSSDQGGTWNTLLEINDIILCLAAHGSKLLAGTAENGLLALDAALP